MERFRQLYRGTPAMLLAIDREGRLLEASERWLARLGCTRERAIGRDFAEFLTPQSAAALREIGNRQLLATGEIRELSLTLVAGDGTRIETLLSVAAGDGQDVPHYLGCLVDASRARSARPAGRSGDAWLRAVLDNAPIEIVLKDTEGRIVALSRNVADSFNLEPEDFVGRTTADFVPAEAAAAYMAADREVLRSGRPLQQEVVETWTGKTVHFLNSKFPLRDESGKITGVCSLTVNVSELKEVQAQLHQAQKMEAVGLLTGGLAHDFNNVLAVVIGNLDLLRLGDGDRSEQAELIRRALDAARNGATLTHRLLAFARKQTLQPRLADVTALVRDTSIMLEHSLGQSVEVRLALEPNLWATVVDPQQVQAALVNLAINARDAMPTGGFVTIGTANVHLAGNVATDGDRVPAGDYIELAVADTGTGMTPEVRKRAMDPFFTTKEPGRGSGLGLSMVYGFVKQSGGHTAIDSEVGKGTTVRLYLPRASGTPAPAVEAATEARVAGGTGEKILIVDDDATVLDMTGRMVRALGYAPTAEADASSALNRLALEPDIAILLSDITLGSGMNGIELAGRVLKCNPAIKVLLMSGFTDHDALPEDMAKAGIDLLKKPFRRATLACGWRRCSVADDRREPPAQSSESEKLADPPLEFLLCPSCQRHAVIE